jgi:hypothetical protein
MHIPLLVKLRIAVIVAVGALAFWKIGWPMLYAYPPQSPLTISLGGQPWSVLGVAIILIIGATLIAAIVARPWVAQLAPLAGLAGLAAWAFLSPGMNSLLMDYPRYGQRTALFYRLIGDTALWFSLVVFLYLLTAGAARVFKKSADSGGGTAPAHPATTPNPSPIKNLSAMNPWVRNILAVITASAAAIILLKLFARDGTVRLDQLPELPMAGVAPVQGQVVFALLAAFALAVMAGFYLFAAPVYVFLACPPLVAAVGYLLMVHNSTLPVLQNAAAVFVPASMVWAAITPLYYIALGSLGVIIGFWFSISLHAPKKSAG